MRINLIPEEERASLNIIQLGTILFIISIVLVALLAFTSAYLYWQVVTERNRLSGYQETVQTLAYYRGQVSTMKKNTQQLKELMNPLTQRIEENKPTVDIGLLFSRVAASAETSSAWLQSLVVNKDGSAPISGYAVDSSEITRFMRAIGQYPFHVVMGATRWIEEDGIKLLEFDARITPVSGGDQ